MEDFFDQDMDLKHDAWYSFTDKRGNIRYIPGKELSNYLKLTREMREHFNEEINRLLWPKLNSQENLLRLGQSK